MKIGGLTKCWAPSQILISWSPLDPVKIRPQSSAPLGLETQAGKGNRQQPLPVAKLTRGLVSAHNAVNESWAVPGGITVVNRPIVGNLGVKDHIFWG